MDYRRSEESDIDYIGEIIPDSRRLVERLKYGPIVREDFYSNYRNFYSNLISNMKSCDILVKDIIVDGPMDCTKLILIDKQGINGKEALRILEEKLMPIEKSRGGEPIYLKRRQHSVNGKTFLKADAISNSFFERSSRIVTIKQNA